MSDSRYGFDEIILRPAVLNIVDNSVQPNNPLLTAVYGSDGRVAYASSHSAVAGYDDASNSFLVTKSTDYGVRVAGVSREAEVFDQIAIKFQACTENAVNFQAYYTPFFVDVLYNQDIQDGEYTTETMWTFVNDLSILHMKYIVAVEAVDDAFHGIITGTNSAQVIQDIRFGYEKNIVLFEQLKESLEALNPKTEENPNPEPVALKAQQVYDLIRPLFADITFLMQTKVVPEDGSETKYEWIPSDRSENASTIACVMGKDCYFYDFWALNTEGLRNGGECQIIQGSGQKNGSVFWGTGVVHQSGTTTQMAQLKAEMMREKFKYHYVDYLNLYIRLQSYINQLNALIQEEYEAEATFFYEYTLAPGENAEVVDPVTGTTKVQPFTVTELWDYQSGINDRINRLEQINEYLKSFAKTTVLVYSSSGILDREMYQAVVAVDENPDATLRDYMAAANLVNDSNFGALLTVYEKVESVIADWREANTELQDALEPKDEDGNVIQNQIRDITVEDLLTIWDTVENMSAMELGLVDHQTEETDFYSAGNFGANANDVFVDTIGTIRVNSVNGMYAIIDGMQRTYYRIGVTISEDVIQEDSNSIYLPGDYVIVDRGQNSDYDIVEDSLNTFQENYFGQSSEAEWIAAVEQTKEAMNVFYGNEIRDAGASLIADLVTERLVTGADTGYSASYRERLNTLLSTTGTILDSLEEVIARQILLEALGHKLQEDLKNSVLEPGMTPSTTAADKYAAAVDNWTADTNKWTLAQLYSYIGVSKNPEFNELYSTYNSLRNSLQAAQEAFGKLNAANFNWDAIYSVLNYFTGRNPVDMLVRDYIYPNVNGGIFADVAYVLNDVEIEWSSDPAHYVQFYPNDPVPVKPDTIVMSSNQFMGLPSDVDKVYSDIGLLEISKKLTTYTEHEQTNTLQQIDYLIERAEGIQKYSLNDREFVFQTAMTKLESESKLAQRKFQLHEEYENVILEWYQRLALDASGILPLYEDEETGTTEEPEKLTYTRDDIKELIDASNAMGYYADMAEDILWYAMRVRAAATLESGAMYAYAVGAENCEELIGALGLNQGDVEYQTFQKITSVKSGVKQAVAALQELLDDPYIWIADSTMTDVEMDQYVLENVLPYLTDVTSTTINGMTNSAFKSYLADTTQQVQMSREVEKEDGIEIETYYISRQEYLEQYGVRFEINQGVLVDAHDIFELAAEPCKDITYDDIELEAEPDILSGISYRVGKNGLADSLINAVVEYSVELQVPNDLRYTGINNTSNFILGDTYAYAVDMLLRTGSKDANLLLEVEGRHRVYSDSQLEEDEVTLDADLNAAMEGSGSYIQLICDDPSNESDWLALRQPESEEQRRNSERALGIDLLRGMRVVFADTVTGQVYATAVAGNMVYSEVDKTVTGYLELVDEYGQTLDNVILKPLVQDQVTAMTAWVYLDAKEVDNTVMNAELMTKLKLNFQFCTDVEMEAAYQSMVTDPTE